MEVGVGWRKVVVAISISISTVRDSVMGIGIVIKSIIEALG